MVPYHPVRVVQDDCFDLLNLEDEDTADLQSNGELLTQYHIVMSQKTRILSLFAD
jgi:hypothetical protein